MGVLIDKSRQCKVQRVFFNAFKGTLTSKSGLKKGRDGFCPATICRFFQYGRDNKKLFLSHLFEHRIAKVIS